MNGKRCCQKCKTPLDTNRRKWCDACRDLKIREQQQAGQKRWSRRVKQGLRPRLTHRQVTRNGVLTKWAKDHPEEAKRLAERRGSFVPAELLALVPAN